MALLRANAWLCLQVLGTILILISIDRKKLRAFIMELAL